MRNQPTLYDVLGVESDATQDQIRAAFRRLTMQHHPDRYFGDERPKAEERFQAITEAFNVLRRPETREKYDRELSKGGQGLVLDKAEIAKRLAAKGAQAYRDGKIPEAIEHLKLAVNHDDECSRAHYFLGLTYSKLEGHQREALRHMERAAQLEPNNTTIRAEEAVLFLAVGMSSRARRSAEAALALDPDNAKATGVLDAIEAPNKAQGEGILARLRRKG